MKYLSLLKSRTFWTIVVMFVISGVNGIREFIPGNVLPVIDGVLAILAVYFAKVNPKINLK